MSRFTLFLLLCILSIGSCLFAGTPAEQLAKQSDDWFKGSEGRHAVACVLSWQAATGDWPKNGDTTREKFSGDRSELVGTFDNGATAGELRVLAGAFRATGNDAAREAFYKGLDHLLEAQYENGGWPQSFPLRKGYARQITFNDDVMVRLLRLLHRITTTKRFDFIDVERRQRVEKALKRGIDCVLKCQIEVNGVPTVWCAQHDEKTFAPVDARSFELASLSGGESAGVLDLLMRLEEPSPEVIKAVKHGVAWFEANKIEGYRYNPSSTKPNLTADSTAGPLWARFYELETGRPFFCTRSGEVKHDVEEIDAERRGGYSWYGGWGEKVQRRYAKWPHR